MSSPLLQQGNYHAYQTIQSRLRGRRSPVLARVPVHGTAACLPDLHLPGYSGAHCPQRRWKFGNSLPGGEHVPARRCRGGVPAGMGQIRDRVRVSLPSALRAVLPDSLPAGHENRRPLPALRHDLHCRSIRGIVFAHRSQTAGPVSGRSHRAHRDHGGTHRGGAFREKRSWYHRRRQPWWG